MRVLDTPREVQDAFGAEMLTLVETAQVGTLTPDKQEQVAQTIREGEVPKDVVRRYRPQGKRKEPRKALEVFIRNVRLGLADFEGRRDTILLLSPDQETTLKHLKAFIQERFKQHTRAVRDKKKRDKELDEDIDLDEDGDDPLEE
jgi:hypothetical protein